MFYRLTHINPTTNCSDYPIGHLEIQTDTPENACRLAIEAMTGTPITRLELGVIQTILDNLWIDTATPTTLMNSDSLLRTPTAAAVVA